MKVRATRAGWYDMKYYKPGDEFELKPQKLVVLDEWGDRMLDEKGKVVMRDLTPEDLFSHKWMERVDGLEVPIKETKRGKTKTSQVEA